MPDTTPVLTINSINIEGDDYQIEDTVARKRANEVALSIYDVGDLYFSMNPASPAARFGGEWEQLENVFIRAANDTETGGSDTITLTEAQMPSHSHRISINRNGNLASGNTAGIGGSIWSGNVAIMNDGITSYTGSTGSGQSHSIMPNYQNVYVWQRVA